jgi:hypothetical protein
MGFLNREKDLGELEEEKERVADELDIEQKKALIAEAKKRYGKDWTKVLGGIHSGMDWDAVKFKLSE